MKNFKYLILMLVLLVAEMNVNAQEISKVKISIDASSSTYVYTQGTTVLTAPSATVSTSTGDTSTLKLYGGDQNDALHFWFAFTKVSGATDSITVTVYGIVLDSKTPSTNTVYKSLYSAQTANSSGEQIFETILTGNNYTNYMVVVRKIGVAAGSGTVKKLCLVR